MVFGLMGYLASIVIVKYNLLFQYFTNKIKPNPRYGSVDPSFYACQENLEAYAKGEICLTLEEFTMYVNEYLMYLPSTQGFSFLVNLNLSFSLNGEARDTLNLILLDCLRKKPFNNLKVTLLTKFLIDKLYIFSIKNLEKVPLRIIKETVPASLGQVQLVNFLNLLFMLIKERFSLINKNTVMHWETTLAKQKTFASFSKEIDFLLLQGLIQQAVMFSLTRVTALFMLIAVLFFSFNSE
jgi:hypothetical protein